MAAMQESDLSGWLRLLLTPGVGNETARRLLTRFGLPQAIFDQSQTALRQVASAAQASALARLPDGYEAQWAATEAWLRPAAGGHAARAIVTLGDPGYPSALLATEDPPLLLYLMGEALNAVPDGPWRSTRSIGMVGSRNPTPQGASNAHAFGKFFSQAGLTVVSGLALGIDAAAHEGALDGGAGDALAARSHVATIAVVGTGLDRVYPKRHLALAHRIAQQGLLVSEYPLGTPAIAANFPRRNRLIAGLSQGVLVVEAALQSGSLITARMASEQGKEVFAIPGSIHAPQSRGCHWLLKQGAKLVETGQDVLEELRLPLAAAPVVRGVDAIEVPAPASNAHPLLGQLGFDPVGLDELLGRTGLDTASLQVQLLELELAGQVARLAGGRFQRIGSA